MLRRLDDTPPQAASARRDAGRGEMRSLRRLFGRRGAFASFLVASVLIPLLLYGFAAYRDWQNVEREARVRVQYVRNALAEHALRVFKTHQLVGYAVEDRIAGRDWAAIAQDAELHRFLARVETDFPEVHAIWLVDDFGIVRASSREFPSSPHDVLDRDWFAEARSGSAPVIVSPRRKGRILQDDFFTLTLRRTGADGSFQGVVQIAVSPTYFGAFYERLAIEGGAIAIVHRSGAVLSRYPDLGSMPATLPPGSPLMSRIQEADQDIFVGRSTFDGRRRLYGYTRVADFPVYVGYGFGEDEIRRRWYERLAAYGVYFIPAALGLVILAFYAWRSHDDLKATVELRTRALSDALAEREQLLKEVHHRVKNNMQIISSLIRMQERVGTSSDETIRRVQAMALVHDLIYTQGQFAAVDLAAYTHRLVDTLRNGPGHGITFNVDASPAEVMLDRAMPFALILSEVLTNAIRHAFKERRGRIDVALSQTDGSVRLRVHDDGFGFNPEVDGRGFGLQLVESLAKQLDASFAFERDQGTTFSLAFPAKTPAA
jgi:two-component sensor histidine kinase/type II secretory pathway pseudopilin PulG